MNAGPGDGEFGRSAHSGDNAIRNAIQQCPCARKAWERRKSLELGNL